jgi:TetR/AcrR family transcriptional repressor of nem operon
MGEKGESNRRRIVEAANELFYHKGYNQTSFSDIADASGLSRGNFYYYFKTKDDILDAVIDYRLDGIRAMLTEWEQTIPEPRDRLKRYVKILLNEEDDLLRYGCPVGSLTVELSKTQLAQQSRAREMFDAFQEFLRRQFAFLGYTESQAHAHALDLLARTQGASLITNVYSDPGFLHRQVQNTYSWLDQF